MIAAADAMVFIVSPDSAASKVCDQEIAFARGIGKRIIPIMRRRRLFGDKPAAKRRFFAWGSRAEPHTKAPPGLAALNVKITFLEDGEQEFTAALDQLCAALDVDVAWHRENRRLTELALKWDAAGTGRPIA